MHDSAFPITMTDAIQNSLQVSADSLNPAHLENAYANFFDIANTATTFEEERIDWNAELAYLKMKELFSSMLRENSINPLDISNPLCSKLIEMENRMIEMNKEKDDDLKEFYYSIDLATTYRLIGDLDKAMEILNRLAPCLRLQDEQVKFLNHWISQIQTEQLVKNGAINIFDFDTYAGFQSSGNREFLKIGNVQANIDTVITATLLPSLPATALSVNDLDGNSYSISTILENGNANYHLQKRNAANNIVWEQSYDGRNKGIDSVKAIMMDDNQRIYVTGKSWNGIDYDVLTIKYDTAGNIYWIAKFNDRQIGNDEALAFEVDSNFKIKLFVRSYNDSVSQFKTIFYSQCDSNCAQNYRLRNAQFGNDGLETADEIALKVYPVPTHDKLNVLLRTSSPGQTYFLSLYDMSGKLVFSKSIAYKYQLDISKFTRGIYQLSVADGNKLLKKRIVIE